MTRRAAPSGVLALLGAATAFSWGFSIVKALPLPDPVIALWRLSIGAAVMGAVAIIFRAPWPPFWRAPILAGLAFGAHQLLFIAATKATSVAIVTLAGAIQPLLVAMVSRRAVGETVPPGLWASTVVAMTGVAVVVFANLDDPSHSLLGDLLSVVNLLAFTAYFLFAKRARLQGAHSLTLTVTVLLFAMLIVLPGALIATPKAPADQVGWLLLVVLALVPGNGHLLLNWAHSRVTATLAALTLLAVPLLASIWAHLLFDEPYGWRHVVGMLLVAVAVEMGRRSDARAAITTPAAPLE